jgi:hypothetical protein
MTTKKKKKTLITPTKAICLSIGQLSPAKLKIILSIRTKSIKISNAMVKSCFKHDFLKLTEYSKEIIQKKYTSPFQKKIKKGVLNKTYIEKVRKSVESSLWEQYKNSIKSLCYAIHIIDKENYYSKSKISKAKRKGLTLPIYKFVPEELDSIITENELNEIKISFKEIGQTKRLDWLRDIIFNKKNMGFNKNQILVIKNAYTLTKNRFNQTRFGINEDFSSTIHFDYRIVNEYKEKVVKIDEHYKWLVDNTNKHYRLFLEISHPTLHSKKIKIPVQLNEEIYKRIIEDQKKPTTQSLLLVIKHDKIEIRSVINKADIETNIQAQYEQVKTADHLIGRDFGYSDTITLSVIKNEFNLSLKEFEERLSLKKEDTKLLYENNSYKPIVVEQFQYSGKNFINKINSQGIKIDKYKSEIDCIYNKIDSLIINIKNNLNVKESYQLTSKTVSNNSFVNALIKKFHTLLDRVKYLKKLRRDCYKNIQGVKKSWFGFLTNIEKRLIKYYNAAIIVEDLTVMAIEKEKPDYKGRSFNKMINNGSKGQYMSMAKEKFLWNGILESKIPSFYSSTTCTIHKVVDDEMRNNKVFKCKQCNIVKDADKNASDTIASFLLLH